MSHKKSDLGRSLYKSRFGKSTKNIETNRRKPMKSVLEETDIQKIFSLGELADKDYTAIRVINNKDREGLLDQVEKKLFEQTKEKYASLLSVPRRPKGAKYISKEQLLATEKENFLKWRLQLAKIETDKRVQLTPYELNLDFWRQLWRVIERSDVLIQVVDARNPLLFRNADLESYVKEVDENKVNIVLINKADFLTELQRKQWADYFDKLNLRVIFWSAKIAEEIRKAEKLANRKKSDDEGVESSDDDLDKNEKAVENNDEEVENNNEEDENNDEEDENNDEEDENNDEDDENNDDEDEISADDQSADDHGDSSSSAESISEIDVSDECPGEERVVVDERSISAEDTVIRNSWEVMGVNEIVELLESIKVPTPYEENKTTVGLVGYPNVGKSSTINAIFGRKKVSVSATPGHTKRFQTLLITEKLTFCDCPGLVMPSVVHSKGHLMVSGILPIDTIRDYIAPINIIADQFPRETLELLYGIQLPPPRDGEDPHRAPTARELLSSYSYMHGMMTSKGNPNLDRAARIILKDYVDGRLLYRHAPPSMEPEQFQSAADLPEEKRFKALPKPSGAKPIRSGIEEPEIPMHDSCGRASNMGYHSRVKMLAMHEAMKRMNTGSAATHPIQKLVDMEEQVVNAKPWRTKTKRCCREKTRRVYGTLDQHAYVYQ